MPQQTHYRSVMMFVAGAACMALVFLTIDTMKKPHPTVQPVQTQQTQQEQSAMPQAAADPNPAPVISEAELKELKGMVEKNPEDVDAMKRLANLYHDGKRYDEAVSWYQKVLQKTPRDVNVSTDLGTVLWYMGKTDEAIAQFEKSLAVDPAHPQTLYNMGIVKLHGKNDAKGALAAWQKLVDTNPNYPQAKELKSRIETLKQMM